MKEKRIKDKNKLKEIEFAKKIMNINKKNFIKIYIKKLKKKLLLNFV